MSKIAETSQSQRRTLRAYVIGYILSLYLTLTAYELVRSHMSGKVLLTTLLIGLAMVQFIVQLLFFLHLGRETRPRWKLLVFFLMILVVSILVFGTLWIMENLNVRMTPDQMTTYMQNQQGL